MGASYYARPLPPDRDHLGCHAPSTVREALEALGRRIPSEFDDNDIPTLRALSVASGDPFYAHLIDSIERHGRVRLEAEY